MSREWPYQCTVDSMSQCMSQMDMTVHKKQWQQHRRSCKLSAFWQQERLEPSTSHAAPAYEPPQPTQQQMRQLTEDEIAQGCKLDPYIGMRVKRLWPEVCLSFACMPRQAKLHGFALHCIALHCLALHCIALHCIALRSSCLSC